MTSRYQEIAALLAFHEAQCRRAKEIMEEKNADYTNDSTDVLANFRDVVRKGLLPSVEASIYVRLSDKLSRLATLLRRGGMVKDESFTDTTLDAINYLILMLYARLLEDGNRRPAEETSPLGPGGPDAPQAPGHHLEAQNSVSGGEEQAEAACGGGRYQEGPWEGGECKWCDPSLHPHSGD